TFSKAMIQPLMYLSVAGMVMLLGVLITNENIREMLPFLNNSIIQLVGNLIYNCIIFIINNLHVIFPVGIAAALAKKEKHHAALIALMSYFMYLTASNTTLSHFGLLAESVQGTGLLGTGQAVFLGIQSIDMSVFGGILIGVITGLVFNKSSHKQFKGVFQIYSGVRFSFFLMILVSIVFGVVATFVWPYAQIAIGSLASTIKSSGDFGFFLYGFLERFLLPTGLHHLIYTPFLYTDLGGVMQLGEQVIVGPYAVFYTEMSMGVSEFSNSILYTAIGFTKYFGYVGIAAAFIRTAYKENKANVKALLIPLVAMSLLASITEPIDFLFCFTAPLLWLVHAGLSGLFIALLSIFNVRVMFGANIISTTISNMVAGVELTNLPMMFLLGFIQMVVYYFVFVFLIKKFNLKTPGRQEESKPEGATAKERTGAKVLESSDDAIMVVAQGFGGEANIESIDNCFTRLRIRVKDTSLLDKEKLNAIKNSGIVEKDCDIQIVYGLQVGSIRKRLEDYLAESGGVA
ncbi:MAG: PTS transporter subunit EIIC, partial [Erysipelotrichaceae bacterium]